jgi:TonB-linked SusC/RagA family outer membrane protein
MIKPKIRYLKRVSVFLMCGTLLSSEVIAVTSLISSSRLTEIAAADVIIKGVVSDAGGPLPGVSVKVEGAKTGVVTDADGRYSISAPEGSVLLFSSLGYTTQRITVLNQTTLNVKLLADTKALEEVVVVGYGTQKKANLTGAVASVQGEELNKRIATNPAQLLQGQLPGLNVTQASGEAGAEGTRLILRGQGTFAGTGIAPLVVIDGIPGDLNALNPNNIASISVLKDAASASIYGSRAANGVILVTTKQGTNGKFALTYTYNLGRTSATALPDFVYNSAQYMELYNRAAINSGSPNRFTQVQIDAYRNSKDRNLYPNFNWLEEVIRPVNVHNHYLNLTGGNGGTTYNLGLGYVDQPDILIGHSYKKLNFQVNLNSKINEKISVGSALTLNNGNRNHARQGSQDLFGSAISQSPLYGPKLPDGSGRYTYTAYPVQAPNKNPVAIAESETANTVDNYLQGTLFLNVALLKGLEWRTTGGMKYVTRRLYDFRPQVPLYNWFAGPNDAMNRFLDVGGQGLTVTDFNSVNPIGFTQLTYTAKVNDHNFTVLAGTQAEYYKEQGLSGSRVVFPNNDIRELNVGGAGAQSNAGNAQEFTLQSYYGRFNYDYKGKYLFETNARYDGSSRFAPGNQWGLFPSVSLGWRLSQEPFFKPLSSTVSDLKFRASLGKLGNQDIFVSGVSDYYPYQDVYSPGYPYVFGSTLGDGLRVTKLTDPNIKWEETSVLDFGLDVGFLNNKLTVTADWYRKNTWDILQSASAIFPGYVGLAAPVLNIGGIRNTGFELATQYNDKVGQVRFSVGGNIQTNRNRVTKYGAPTIQSMYIIQEGLPYNSYYIYEFEKIFQTVEEIAAAPSQPFNPKPGMLKFKDQNGDNKIDGNDRKVFEGAFPKFDYSFNSNVEYKNFDLSVLLYGSHGRKEYVTNWGVQPFQQNAPPTTEWINSWTPENRSETLPMIYLSGTGNANSNITTLSTFYLKDASFLRIKNVQLGYHVPAKFAKRVAMNNLRLYISGENLVTFSKFPGLDPERIVGNNRYITHPQNKVFNFGVRAGF